MTRSLCLEARCARRRLRQTRMGAWFFCLVAGQNLQKGEGSCPHEEHALKRPAGTPNSACWCHPHASAGQKYLATFFAALLCRGTFERLCDLFAWKRVRRDGPRALVCQREMWDVTVTIVADLVWKIPRYAEGEQHHWDRARAAVRAECAGS